MRYFLLCSFVIMSLLLGAWKHDYRKMYLPDGATMRLGKGQIGEIAYSPNGKRLAVASSIGIWLYDARTYKEIALLTGNWEELSSHPYTKVRFSPDGKILATTSNREIWLWDTYTGNKKAILSTHEYAITSIVFSPDGKTLASGSYDKTIRLWDVQTGTLQTTLRGQKIMSLAFSPNGKTLVSGNMNNTIQLWDLKTGQVTANLTGHEGWISALAFYPFGEVLISGSRDKTIRIWELKNKQHIQTLTGHIGEVNSLAISPDGETFVSAGNDGTIRFWELNTTKHKFTVQVHSICVNIAFSSNGNVLAYVGTDGNLQFYDAATGQHKATITGHAAAGFSESPLAFSSDSELLLGIGKLWDPNIGHHKLSLTIHTSYSQSGVFSPDKKILAIENYAGIFLCYTQTGVTKTVLIGQADEVACISFSPDGKTLASGCADKSDYGDKSKDTTIRLWDTQTCKIINTLIGHTGGVICVTFSPDGKTLASGSEDSTIRLWDTKTGQHKTTLIGHTGYVTCIAFSPDGQSLASGNRFPIDQENKNAVNSIRLWNVHTERHKKTLFGHKNGILSVDFSPDGKRLVSGSRDGTVRVWNTHTGEHLTTL